MDMDITINMKQFIEIVRMGKYLEEKAGIPKEIVEDALINISMEQNLPMIYI